MKLQIQIDDNLLQEALTLGKHEDQQVLIEESLKEYIQRRKRLKVLDLFGQIDYDDSYDYKKQRYLS
jgi:Uma2 family endonuclease